MFQKNKIKYERSTFMILSDMLIPPKSLLVYDALLPRHTFSPQEKQYYEQLYKGFIGEKRLEKHIVNGHYPNVLPLFDCLFEVGGREFQIDCILLTSDTIFLLEVKNYTGDYYIENGNVFHLQTEREIFNPIDQLKRTEFSFQRLLDNLKINYKVLSYVLFVNHNFMLYGVNVHSPIIFPSQIKRFLQKTNANVNPITERTKRIAKTLRNKSKESSTYEKLPEYDFNGLKRGVFCETCFTDLTRKTKFKITCTKCDKTYPIDKVVLFAVAQFHLLFPNRKITPKSIAEWCLGFFSKNSIRRILVENLKIKLNGSHSYYYYNDENDHWKTLINKYR